MQDNVDLLQDLEDAEDALSLCDLPLHHRDDELNIWEDASAGDSQTSWEHEHFEFSSDPKVETCPPENIIFCGKHLPSKQPLSHHTHIPKTFEFHPRLRSEQLNFYKLQSSSFGNDRGGVISTNSSVGYNKFQRTSSSRASRMASPSSYQPPMKPRWYMGLFGLTRFSPKMEVEDLRIRQDRLSRPVLKGGETVSVKSGGKGSWGYSGPLVVALPRLPRRRQSVACRTWSNVGLLPHVLSLNKGSSPSASSSRLPKS